MRTVLLLILVASLAGCRARELTFASIPWGTDAAEVERRMVEREFKLLGRPAPHGDHLYAGTFAGRPAVVVARMAEGRVVKFEVALQAPQEERASLFRAVESQLAEEYGGLGGAAHREDPGSVTLAPVPRRSVWSREGSGGESYLILEDRPELAVVIAFESPAWHREFLRRRGE